MTIFQQFFLLPLFLLVTAFQFVHSQENPEVSKLETFYYNKCFKTTGNTAAFDKLRTDVYEMYKYFEYAFQFLPNERQAFCKEQRSNLLYRIKDVENDLKPCLANGEKYFAGFIRESFEEFLHFLCHNSGEYTKRVFSTEALQCRKKIVESNTSDLDNCLNRIFSPTGSFVTKKEMCDDVTVARKCFTQLLDVHCPSSYDFKKLNKVFFDFIGKPCASCVHLISTFVLIGSVLVHFFFK